MSQKRNAEDVNETTAVAGEYSSNGAQVNNNYGRPLKAPKFSVVKVGETVECEIYKPETEKDRIFVVAESIRKLGTVQSNEQCVAHVANVIWIIIPELKQYLDSALSELGINCVEVKLPSEEARVSSNTINNGVRYTWPVIMVLLGCMILTISKNCHNQNYETYLRDRIEGMRAPARVHQAAVIKVPFGNDKGKAIRLMLGSHSVLKEGIVQAITELSERGDLVGSVCKYLLRSLNTYVVSNFTHNPMYTC